MLARDDLASAQRSYAAVGAPGPAGVLVLSGPFVLFNLHLTADDVNDAAILLFDNTAASGASIRFRTPVSTSMQQEWESTGIRFLNGLFVQRATGLSGWTAAISYIAE